MCDFTAKQPIRFSVGFKSEMPAKSSFVRQHFHTGRDASGTLCAVTEKRAGIASNADPFHPHSRREPRAADCVGDNKSENVTRHDVVKHTLAAPSDQRHFPPHNQRAPSRLLLARTKIVSFCCAQELKSHLREISHVSHICLDRKRSNSCRAQLTP